MSDASSTTVSTSFVTDASSIEAYNRGPITAIFEPPTSCLATLTLNQDNRKDLYWGHLGNSYVDLGCYPTPTVQLNNLVTGSSWDTYWYSPAICPQSWTIATTFESTMPGPNDETLVSLSTDTSAGVCCPSGYSYNGLGHQCTSKLTQNQVVQYVLPTNNGNSIDRGSVSTSTVASDSVVNGDGVPIWWQSSDSKVLAAASTMTPTATGPTTAPTTGAQTGPTTSIPSQTGTPPPDGSGGLSTGAKAGIGVGVPLAVIAVAAIAFLLFRRRRKNGDVVDGSEAHPGMHSYDPKPHADLPRDYYAHQHQGPQELYSESQTHELPESGYR